jgi:hypothetical protein
MEANPLVVDLSTTPRLTELCFGHSRMAMQAFIAYYTVRYGRIQCPVAVFNFLIINGKLNRKKVRIFYTSKPYVDYVYVARKECPRPSEKDLLAPFSP